MEKKKVICLFLFVFLILVSSSCQTRNMSDIQPAMTKEKVISLWGPTNLITYKDAGGVTLEIWEYHFASSDSICSIIFVQDRVARTECRPEEKREYQERVTSKEWKKKVISNQVMSNQVRSITRKEMP